MERQYISVFALNKYIKAKMNQDVHLQNVYIKGEISNYRPHPSGHLYFTLKDENSRINAIMFSSLAKHLDFEIQNGMQVLLEASVSVYEVTGQYQLYVKSIQEDGIGHLYFMYEQLKTKLEKEGLFDSQYKKGIPHFPKAVAVLSAKQGAAVQDVVRTIQLRFPFTKVIVFPIPVQGKDAYISIIDTLKMVDSLKFDTIILARGGGSIEDLWNFNEESLARCIFDLKTPIITGIGHETDFTICDFVSDYRGVTPTAAAIKATPDQNELKKHTNILYQQLVYKMQHYIDFKSQYFHHLKKSYYLRNPEMYYSHEILRLAKCQDQLSYQFKMFDTHIFQQLIRYQDSLKTLIDKQFIKYEKNNQLLFSKLDALSPLKVMKRGYTLVKKDGDMIKNVNQLQSGDDVDLVFWNGETKAQIK